MNCTFSPRMRCYWPDNCPMQDHRFSDLLDRWVFTDREPPSLNWQRGGIIDNHASERRALEKCEITRLFQWPERLQWFVAHGHITRWLCEDLRRGYFIWKDTQAGISLRRAKARWKGK